MDTENSYEAVNGLLSRSVSLFLSSEIDTGMSTLNRYPSVRQMAGLVQNTQGRWYSQQECRSIRQNCVCEIKKKWLLLKTSEHSLEKCQQFEDTATNTHLHSTRCFHKPHRYPWELQQQTPITSISFPISTLPRNNNDVKMFINHAKSNYTAHNDWHTTYCHFDTNEPLSYKVVAWRLMHRVFLREKKL